MEQFLVLDIIVLTHDRGAELTPQQLCLLMNGKQHHSIFYSRNAFVFINQTIQKNFKYVRWKANLSREGY